MSDPEWQLKQASRTKISEPASASAVIVPSGLRNGLGRGSDSDVR